MLFATILVFELLNTDNPHLEYCDWAEHTYIKMQRQTFTFHSLFKSRIVLPFWNLWKHFNCTIKSFDGLLSCCRTGLAQLNFLWINPVWNENSFTLLWQLPENLLKNAHFRSIFFVKNYSQMIFGLEFTSLFHQWIKQQKKKQAKRHQPFHFLGYFNCFGFHHKIIPITKKFFLLLLEKN